MTTIDKLDIGVYINYARRTEFVEYVNKQYGLDKAATMATPIAPDFYPRARDIDLLLGVAALSPPWAMFLPPKYFDTQRRNPFGFLQIAPSLGKQEDQEENEKKLDEIEVNSEEEKEEKATMKRLFEQIEDINDLIGFVIGRVGQFLQG